MTTAVLDRLGDEITLEGIAFDYAGSVRTKDHDGVLHVALANISKANVCPYVGHEIPGWRTLGLDGEKIYNMLRDPEELRKAAATSNNKQLLKRHVPVNAQDHQPAATVGSTGTDAVFEHPFLKNSLSIWAGDAIRDVESEAKKELSSGYHYRPDMTPGTYEGQPYDGVMRDIKFNHVALVKEGRAGADVVVGDSTENLEIIAMSKTVLTRKAAMAQGAVIALLAPKLAQDAKVDLTGAFNGVTAKNYTEKQPEIRAAIAKACEGKLAADAKLDDVHLALDSMAAYVPAEDAAEVPAKKPAGEDGAETDEEKAARLKKEKAAVAKAKAAAKQDVDDGDDDDYVPAQDMVTKTAMDAAISEAVKRASADGAAAGAAEAVRTQREIRDAENAVRPYVGNLAVTCDSAEQVYRTALKTMNVPNIDSVHASALPVILGLQAKPGEKKAPSTERLGMDAKAAASFAERYPEAARINA